MPTVMTRLYQTNADASAVAEKLKEMGYEDEQLDVIAKPSQTGFEGGETAIGESAETTAARLQKAGVYATAAKKYADKMSSGETLVVLRAPFGYAGPASPIMDSAPTIDAGVKYETNATTMWANPTNVIRVSGRQSIVERRANPAKKPSTTPYKPMLGLKTIIQPKKSAKRPSHAPITKSFFPTLSARKQSSGRPKNLAKPSSSLGFPLLIRKQSNNS